MFGDKHRARQPERERALPVAIHVGKTQDALLDDIHRVGDRSYFDQDFRAVETLQSGRSEKFVESGIRGDIVTFLAQQLSEILHPIGNEGAGRP